MSQTGFCVTHHPLYILWVGMIQRCENVNNSHYKYYGGRGIKVCPRWRNSFTDFLEDVGERPSPRHTLDRYPNVDGDYSKDNFRWATYDEQSRNKRSNRYITWRGETLILKDWATRFGVHISTLAESIKKYGEEDAFRFAEMRLVRGRRRRGIHRGHVVNTSKLTEQQAREIKSILALGVSSYGSILELARRFNVSDTAIRLIRNGKNWAWLEVS